VVSESDPEYAPVRTGTPLIIVPISTDNPIIGEMPTRTAPTSKNTNHTPVRPNPAAGAVPAAAVVDL
jgi:hypothetical protein